MDLGSSLQRFHIDVSYQNLRNLMVMTDDEWLYYVLLFDFKGRTFISYKTLNITLVDEVKALLTQTKRKVKVKPLMFSRILLNSTKNTNCKHIISRNLYHNIKILFSVINNPI